MPQCGLKIGMGKLKTGITQFLGRDARAGEQKIVGHFTKCQARREGFEMSDAIETVFERFEIVWPPDVADRSG